MSLSLRCRGGVACADRQPRLVPINEDGCVTASGDEFILTDLHPGERSEQLEHVLPKAPRARPTTEAYLLMGDEEQLRTLVGRRVRVAGVADPAQVAELREFSPHVSPRPPEAAGEPPATAGGAPPSTPPSEPAATSGTKPGAVTPKVGTQYQLRMEIHRMRPTSIAPTGDSCGPMTNPGS